MNQIRRITEEERRQKNINVSDLYNENLLLKTELARVRGLLQREREALSLALEILDDIASGCRENLNKKKGDSK